MVANWVGRKLMESTLNDMQMRMIESVQGDPRKPTMAETFVNAATKEALGTMGGAALGVVEGSAGVVEGHKAAIEAAAKEGIPGFAHERVEADGVTYHVWVDASPDAFGQNPDIYTIPPRPPFKDQDTAGFEAARNQVINKAMDELHQSLAKDGPSGYERKLQDFIDEQNNRSSAVEQPQPETRVAAAPSVTAPASTAPSL